MVIAGVVKVNAALCFDGELGLYGANLAVVHVRTKVVMGDVYLLYARSTPA